MKEYMHIVSGLKYAEINNNFLIRFRFEEACLWYTTDEVTISARNNLHGTGQLVSFRNIAVDPKSDILGLDGITDTIFDRIKTRKSDPIVTKEPFSCKFNFTMMFGQSFVFYDAKILLTEIAFSTNIATCDPRPLLREHGVVDSKWLSPLHTGMDQNPYGALMCANLTGIVTTQ